MCSVFHFFCKDVTWVDNVGDVSYFGLFIVMTFSDLIFTEVEMFDTFDCDRDRPLETHFIAIVYIGLVRCV